MELIDRAIAALNLTKLRNANGLECPVRCAVHKAPRTADKVREVEHVERELHMSAAALREVERLCEVQVETVYERQ